MLITIDTNKVAKIVKNCRGGIEHSSEWTIRVAEDLAKYFKKQGKWSDLCSDDTYGHGECIKNKNCADCEFDSSNFDPKDFIKKCGG